MEPSHTATATLVLNVVPADLRPPWFLPCTFSDGYVCIQAQYHGAVPTGHTLVMGREGQCPGRGLLGRLEAGTARTRRRAGSGSAGGAKFGCDFETNTDSPDKPIFPILREQTLNTQRGVWAPEPGGLRGLGRWAGALEFLRDGEISALLTVTTRPTQAVCKPSQHQGTRGHQTAHERQKRRPREPPAS